MFVLQLQDAFHIAQGLTEVPHARLLRLRTSMRPAAIGFLPDLHVMSGSNRL